MNNKGFTLVELLAVIIILSLLAVLASTSVTKVIKNSKSDLYNSQLTLIKSAAEAWGADNMNKLPSAGECKYITLSTLKGYGLIDNDIKNPKTNKNFNDNLYIKISSNLSKYGVPIIEYEVDAKSVEGCEYASLCTLVSDADNSDSITPGDKYSCEVKAGTNFNFYVLSTNEDGTINLIMDRNICDDGTAATEENTCLISWISEKDYELAGGTKWAEQIDNTFYGPITAMNYLYKATKDWVNVPNIIINYTNSESVGIYYRSIITNDKLTQLINGNNQVVKLNQNRDGYLNLKARMISGREAFDYRTDGSNGYIYDNLDNECYSEGDYGDIIECNFKNGTLGENTNHINGILGYWTLSSADPVDPGLGVYSAGYVTHNLLHSWAGGSLGIRPVITISKSNIS